MFAVSAKWCTISSMEDVMQVAETWINQHQATLVSVVVIFVGAWLVMHFGDIAIKKAVAKGVKLSDYKSTIEEKKRRKTVEQILNGALRVVVWPLAIMLVVAQLGVEIGPLIAGAGIIGLAVGFGAQSLVKDIIAGLFIIVENQYGVGDVVQIAGITGQVKRITLRKTVLRDLDGIVHHIPNGTIDKASNYSSEYSGINLNVSVAYDTDIDKLTKIVNSVGEKMAKDPMWKEAIIEVPSFLRVDRLGDSSMDIKITGTVKPLKQWDVTGELRKRIKEAFDKERIVIPYPQTVVHYTGKIK